MKRIVEDYKQLITSYMNIKKHMDNDYERKKVFEKLVERPYWEFMHGIRSLLFDEIINEVENGS